MCFRNNYIITSAKTIKSQRRKKKNSRRKMLSATLEALSDKISACPQIIPRPAMLRRAITNNERVRALGLIMSAFYILHVFVSGRSHPAEGKELGWPTGRREKQRETGRTVKRGRRSCGGEGGNLWRGHLKWIFHSFVCVWRWSQMGLWPQRTRAREAGWLRQKMKQGERKRQTDEDRGEKE